MAKTENYTKELTAKIRADYAAGVTVEDIAAAIGKTKRSVVSKLVREGVYVAPEKPAPKAKDEGPSKKELLATLHGLIPSLDIDGGVNASKPFLSGLIAQVEALQAVADESQDEAAA